MRKRIRLAESNKEEFAEEDCISALPDDTLVAILSRLPLKQAVVTSILSRRWRYLWTNVAELDFDADYALDTIAAAPRWRSSERSKYIKWVNRVLRQHRGLVLDGVRICFDLDISSKRTVDRWVKFAIGKRVQSLELDLLEYGEKYHQSWKNYTFPHKLLGRCKGMSLNNVYSNHALMQPSMPSCLEYLSLKSVNVSDEALDCFFSNCPDLKYLKIHGSGYLKNVKVSGLTLGLKHLEIVYCTVIETIEISNVNLEVFTYLGRGINLSVDNVPMLDEIFIGEGNSGLERNVFEQLSCCLYQLQILTLYIHRPEENKMVSAFPVLPDLKVLNLDVGAWDDESLLEFTSLIKACPKLNTFVLKLLWISPSKTRREVRQGVKCTHSYLKRVEIKGYYGRTSDAEAAMYFMKNAVALKKIVIDPRERTNKRSVTISRIMKEVSARKCARKQLEPKKPHGVQLIIL